VTQAVVGDVAEAARLDRSLVHGLAWTGSARWATQVFAWVGTLIVARTLTPADFGLVTMAQVYLGLIMVVSEFGIGSAVITLRELSDDQLSQLNTTSLFLGAAGFLATAVAADPLARFFRAPLLPPVLIATATGFVVASFGVVPAAMLQRQLRFRSLALIDLVRGTLIPAATVLFALAGLRYWSLVLGGLTSSVVGTLLTLRLRRLGFRWPRHSSLRPALQFSWHVLVGRLSWYVYSNADFAVAGRTLGQVALGAYTLAWTLATAAAEKVTNVVSGVAPAFLSALQTDATALRRYCLDITEGVALVTIPLTVGMALVADQFVALALGAKWEAAVGPLRLLAVYTAVRSITPVLPHVLTATRNTRFLMWTSLLAAGVLPTAFYIGSRWGTVGIAAAWMVAHPLVMAPLFWKAFRRLDLSPSRYLHALRPALEGAALMTAAVVLTRGALSDWPLAARFTVEVLVGAGAYVGVAWSLHRTRLRAFYMRLRVARAAV